MSSERNSARGISSQLLSASTKELLEARMAWAEKVIDDASVFINNTEQLSSSLKARFAMANHVISKARINGRPAITLASRVHQGRVETTMRIGADGQQSSRRWIITRPGRTELSGALTMVRDHIEGAWQDWAGNHADTAVFRAKELAWRRGRLIKAVRLIGGDKKKEHDLYGVLHLWVERKRDELKTWRDLHVEVDERVLAFNAVEERKTYMSFIATNRMPARELKPGPHINRLPRIAYITRNQPTAMYTKFVSPQKAPGLVVLNNSLITRHKKGRMSRKLMQAEHALCSKVRILNDVLNELQLIERIITHGV